MKDKALFIHIAKTGGSSITEALNPNIVKHGSLGTPTTGEFMESFKFRFSFVRNPYTRFASAVLNLGFATPETFTDFVLKTFAKEHEEKFKNLTFEWLSLLPQSKLLYFKGKVEVDFIGRFEDFEGDLREVYFKLYEAAMLEVPHSNKGDYSGKDYMKYYTPETKAIITKAYEEDFERLGYDK